MTNHSDNHPSARRLRLAAGAVHVFTASGALCAYLALDATLAGRYEFAFIWLGIALIIDGVDGIFARAVDVRRRLPRFSGEQLDLVVDYTTYVFVPALMLHHAGFLSGGWGKVLVALILLSSLFHFADTASKSADNCFVGFPAIWNIVAFYAFALGLSAVVVGGVVVLCTVLTFVPLRWVHPLRVERFRRTTVAVTLIGGAAATAAVLTSLPAAWPLQAILVAVGLYGVALTTLWPWIGDDATGQL